MKTIINRLTLLSLFTSACLIFLYNCGGSGENSDTPTSGKVWITVDETFSPVIDSQVFTFEKIYVNAKVNARYKPEAEVMNDLLSDSSRLVILPRRLNAEEREYFKKLEIVPRETKIFYDAIAVILNKSNSDTLMSFDKLKEILSGKITKWKQVNNKSNLGDISIVYDNPNSSTVRLIKEKIEGELAKNSYALKSNEKVVSFIAENKNAMGIIGVNWVSDQDDTLALSFLKTVNVVGLRSDMPNTNPNEYFKPYQAYIALKNYPLIREVYIISREARNGLGTGFSAFVAGEKGQRIFLKSGLVPATMPIRLVETYSEEL